MKKDKKTASKTGTEEHQELMPLDEDSKLRQAQVSESNKSILMLANDFDIDANESAETLIKEGVADINQSMHILVRSGVRLSIAKDKCAHGEFSNICEQMGLSTFRASEAMRYAKYLSTVPEKDRSKFLTLPKKSALVLGNADPEVIEFLLDDENYEQAKTLKNKTQLSELVDGLQKAEEINEKQNNENIALQEEVDALKQAQTQSVAGSEYPEHVSLFRKEAPVLAEEALADLFSLERLANRYTEFASSDPKEQLIHRNAALLPALANISSIAHNALNLFHKICDEHEINPEDIATFSVPMNESEIEIIEASRLKVLHKRTMRGEDRAVLYRKSGAVKFSPGRPFEYLN